jgi:hypothetical protein
MRTSLNNIKAIDDYLLGHMAPGEALLFEAKMLLNSSLVDDVRFQQSTYSIVRKYSRQSIKAEILAVQETLATAPEHRGFTQRIANLFKKP